MVQYSEAMTVIERYKSNIEKVIRDRIKNELLPKFKKEIDDLVDQELFNLTLNVDEFVSPSEFGKRVIFSVMPKSESNKNEK